MIDNKKIVIEISKRCEVREKKQAAERVRRAKEDRGYTQRQWDRVVGIGKVPKKYQVKNET